jgi:hypothetical protein
MKKVFTYTLGFLLLLSVMLIERAGAQTNFRRLSEDEEAAVRQLLLTQHTDYRPRVVLARDFTPAADECDGAPLLSLDHHAHSGYHHFLLKMNDATRSDIANVPACGNWGQGKKDKWVRFIVPENAHTLYVGTQFDKKWQTERPTLAFYRGISCEDIAFFHCIEATGPSYEQSKITGLTPGETVWLRMAELHNTNEFEFELVFYWEFPIEQRHIDQFYELVHKKGDAPKKKLPSLNPKLTLGNSNCQCRVCLTTGTYDNFNWPAPGNNCNNDPQVCGWLPANPCKNSPANLAANPTAPGGGQSIENPVFLYFDIPAGPPVVASITVNVFNCQNPNLSGLQLAIYDHVGAGTCSGPPSQQGGCNGFLGFNSGLGTLTVNSIQPLPQGRYLLAVDGFAGNQCQFSFTGNVVNQPGVLGNAPQIQGENVILCGNFLTLSVVNAPANSTFSWFIPPAINDVMNPDPPTNLQVLPPLGPIPLTGSPHSFNVSVNGPATPCQEPCPAQATAAFNLNVLPLEAPQVGSNSPLCVGQTLLLSGGPGPNQTDIASTLTYTWTGPNGFQSNLQNPTIPNASTAATGTYTLAITRNGCASVSSTIDVIVNALPLPPLANGIARCDAGQVTFTFVGAAAGPNINEVLLYTLPTGGTPNVTDNSVPYELSPTPNPNTFSTITYYGEAVSVDGCTSANRSQAVVDIVPVPSPPRVATSSMLPVPANVTDPITVWIADTIRRCEIAPAGSNNPQEVSFEAVMGAVPGTSIGIWDAQNGGNLIATIPIGSNPDNAPPYTFTIPAVTATSTYWLEAVRIKPAGATPAINCTSARRELVILINPLPGPPTAPLTLERCGTGSVTITAQMGVPAGQRMHLYTTTLAGGFPVATDDSSPYSFVTPSITSTPFLQVTQDFFLNAINTLTGCTSAFSTVSVQINPLPNPPTVPNVQRCNPGTVTFTVDVGQPLPGDLVRLYTSSAPGIQPIDSACATCVSNPLPLFQFQIPNNGNVPTITTTTTFIFESVISLTGCTNRRSARAEIIPNPPPPDVINVARCEAGSVTFSPTLNGAGNEIRMWTEETGGVLEASDNTIPFQLETVPITTTSTYYFETVLFVNPNLSCTSSTRTPALAIINFNPAIPRPDTLSRCGAGSMTFNPQLGTVASPPQSNQGPADQIRMYNVPAGGILLGTATAPNFLIQTPTTSATTTYYFEAINTSTGCRSPRIPGILEILANPGAPVIISQPRCGGGVLTLTVQTGNPAGDNLSILTLQGAQIQTASGSPVQLTTSPIQASTDFLILSVKNYNTLKNQLVSCSTNVTTRAIVNPLPGQVISRDEARCGNGQVTFLAIFGTPIGNAMILYGSPTGNDTVKINGVPMIDYNAAYELTTPVLQAQCPATVQDYYIEALDQTTGCRSATRTLVRATAHCLPGAPLSQNVSRCGPGSVVFTAQMSNPPGQFMRLYDAPSGGTPIVETGLGNTHTLLTQSIATTTTFYLAAVNGGTFCEARSPWVARIDSIPTAPVSSNVTVCGPGNVVNFTAQLVGSAANKEVRLYTQPVGGVPIATDGARPYILSTVSPINTTTTFYLENFDIITGCAARSPVTVIVDTVSPPVSQNVSRCGAGNVTITAVMGPRAGSAMHLFDTPLMGFGVAPLAIDDSAPYELPLSGVSSSGLYYLRAIGANGCMSDPVQVQVTIFEAPAAPSVVGSSRCGSGSLTLSVTMGNPQGDAIRIYTQAVGGAAISVDDQPPYLITTPSITTSVTYYPSAYSSQTGCESERVGVVAQIFPIPGVPQVQNVRRCSTGVLTFTAFLTAPAAQQPKLFIYTGLNIPGAIDSVSTSPYLLRTPSISSQTTYYFGVRDGVTGCQSQRIPAIASIDLLPADPIVDPVSVCGRSHAVFTVLMGSPAGNEILMFDSPGGTAPVIAFDNSAPYELRTPEVGVTTSFYFESINTVNGCRSSRIPSEVFVNPIPTLPQAADVARCGPGQLTITVVGASPGQEVLLYTQATGGAPIVIDQAAPYELQTDPIASDAVRYVSIRDPLTRCESARRGVNLRINPLPGSPDYLGSPARCGAGLVTITALMGQPSGQIIQLLDAPVAGNQLAVAAAPPYLLTTNQGLSATLFLQSVNTQTNCASDIRPVPIVINEEPGIPVVLEQPKRCGNGRLTFTVTMGTPAGNQVNLYSTISGGVVIASDNSSPYILTTPELDATSNFWIGVRNTVTGCESNRVAVVGTVLPVPGQPAANAVSRCGSGSVTLTGVMGNPEGSRFRLYSLPSGGNVLQTVPKNNSLTTDIITTTTQVYITAFEELTGCESSRATVNITINPLPGLPEGQNVFRCGNGRVTFSALMGNPAGNVVRLWDNGIPGSGSLVASDFGAPYELSTGVLAANTTFYLEAFDSQTGCVSERRPVVAIVNPLPGIPEAEQVSRCGPGNVEITASFSNPSGDALRLYDGPVAGTLLGERINPPYRFTTQALSVNTTLYVESVNLATGCVSNRRPVSIRINPLPGIPRANNLARCEAGILTFTAIMGSPAGSEIRLQDLEGNTLQSATGPNFLLESGLVTTHTTFYLQSVNTSTGCLSERSAVTVTIHRNPGIPTAELLTRCGRGVVTFTAVMGAPIGTEIRLFDTPQPGAGNLLARDVIAPYELTSPLVAINTTFYLESFDSQTGCSSQRSEAIVELHPIPGIPTVVDVSRCGPGVLTFSPEMGNPGGTELRLYDIQTGGTILDRDALVPFTLSTPRITQTGNFFISSFDAKTGCESDRVRVRAEIEPLPGQPFASDVSVCGNQPVIFSVLRGDPPGQTIKLFDAVDAQAEIAAVSESPYNIDLGILPVGTHTYYISAEGESGNCKSPRLPVRAIVNPTPTEPQALDVTRCTSGPVTFTAQMGLVPGTEIRLYSVQTGGNVLAVDNSAPYQLTTSNLTTSATFYIESYSIESGCPSLRAPVRAILESLPRQPIVNSVPPVCVGDSLVLTATGVVGAEYIWRGPQNFEALGAVIKRSITNTLQAGVYTVVTRIGACTSAATTIRVNVVANPQRPVGTFYNQYGKTDTLCVGNELNLAVVNFADYPPGTQFEWIGPFYYLNDVGEQAFHPFPAIPNVVTNFEGSYFVRARVGGCASQLSEPVDVKIREIPLTPTATNSGTRCEGSGVVALQASNVPTALNYVWTGPNGFNIQGQTGSVPAIIPNAGVYSVVAVNAAGCTSLAGTTQVVIQPRPLIPSPQYNGPICEGENLVITAFASPRAEYTLQGPNGYLGYSATSNVFPLLNADISRSGIYTLTTVTGVCTSISNLQVIVNPAPPKPNAGASSPLCSGDLLRLSASGVLGAEYYWQGPNNFFEAGMNPRRDNVSLLDGGNYSVVAVVNGCTSVAQSVNVEVKPLPRIPLTSNSGPHCIGQTLRLSAISDPGASYTWRGPGGWGATGAEVVRIISSTDDAGDYRVIVRMEGCSSQAITRVVIHPVPPTPVAKSNGPRCVGEILSLTIDGDLRGEYFWQGPGNFSGYGASISRQINNTAQAGLYSVTAIIDGCTSSVGTIGVVINPIPATPSVGNNGPLCEGQNLRLTAAGLAAGQYVWNGPGNYMAAGAAGDALRNGVRVRDAGLYNVVVVANGCTSLSASTNVIIRPVPEPAEATDNGKRCIGQQLQLSVVNAIPGNTYIWAGPAGFTATGSTVSRVINSVTEGGVYNVWAVVGNCTSAATSRTIQITPTPEIPLIRQNGPVCERDLLILTAYALDMNQVSYRWEGPNSFEAAGHEVSRRIESVLDAGTYTVTARIGECLASATVAVEVHQKPQVTISSNSPVCSGGALQLTAPSITGAYYIWNGPSGFVSTLRAPSRANMQSLQAGTYFLTLIQGACTTEAFAVDVTVLETPSAPRAGYNGPLCTGQTLTLTTNAVVGAEYVWSGPQGFSSSAQNPVIDNVTTAEAGVYSVFAKRGDCISPVSQLSVVINPTPLRPVAGATSFACTGQNLQLTAQSEGAFTYRWSGPNGYFSSVQNPLRTNITIAEAGDYTVQGIRGSCLSEPVRVRIEVVQTPVAPEIGNNGPVCSGQELQLTSAPLANVGYSWSGPNNFSSTLQNPIVSSVTSSATGVYSLVVFQNGCTSGVRTTRAVINPAPSVITLSSNTPLCAGQTLLFTATQIPGALYSWSGPAGWASAQPFPQISNAQPSQSGIYSLQARLGNCASPVYTTEVIIGRQPANPVATSNSPVCSGEIVQLFATQQNGVSYLWSGPNVYTSTAQNPQLVNAQTGLNGVYSVIAISGGCTSSMATVTVNVLPAPAPVQIRTNAPVCSGDTLRLSIEAQAGAQYSWSGPGNFSSVQTSVAIPNATSLQSGVYSVQARLGNCVAPVTTRAIQILPRPSAPILGYNGPLCVGQRLELRSSAVPGAQFSWVGPNGFSSLMQNPSKAEAFLADAGRYEVEVEVNGCRSPKATLEVKVNPIPPTPQVFNNGPLCQGETITLTTTPVVEGATYNWSGPDNFSASSLAPTIPNANPAASGTYALTITINNCVSAPGSTNVLVQPLPNLTGVSSNSPVCSGGLLSLTANFINNATYRWIGPNGFTSIDQSPVRQNITLNDAGVYLVNAIVNGCTSQTQSIPVTVQRTPFPMRAGNNGPLCAGQALQLTASTFTGARYIWSGPDGFSTQAQNPQFFNAGLSQNGVYSVIAILGNCSSEIATTQVVIKPTPGNIIAGSNSPICSGETLFLTSTSIPGAKYEWRGPDNFYSEEPNPTRLGVTNMQAGTYSVIAILGGCTSRTATNTLSVRPIPEGLQVGNNGPVCLGSNLSLSANSSTLGVEYFWNGPNGFTSSMANPVFPITSASQAGVYSLVARLGACTAPVQTTNVVASPSPGFISAGSNAPVCEGQVLSFTATGVAGANYKWLGPQNYSSTEQNPVIYNVSSVQSGTYSVVAYIGNCTSNVAVAAGVVNLIPKLLSVGSNSPACTGRTLELTAIGQTGASYLWLGPNGYASTGANAQRAGLTLNDAGAYSAVAILQGCTSQSKSAMVDIRPTPATPTIASNAPLCAGETLQLTAPSLAGATYEWQGPNGFISSLPSVTLQGVKPEQGGLYSLAWTINGCVSDTAVTNIIINQPSVRMSAAQSQICPGDTLNLLFGLGGNGPWAVELLRNGLPETVLMNQSPFVWSVNPLVTTTYELKRVTDSNGCITQIEGSTTVSVGSMPDITILQSSNNNWVCAGSSASLNVEVRGATNNWSLVYEIGNRIETVTGSQNGVVAITTPPIAQSGRLRLISISNANENPSCIRSLSGANTEAYIQTYPLVGGALNVETTTICEGKGGLLPITLNGVGPWKLKSVIGGKEQLFTFGSAGQAGPLNVDFSIPEGTRGSILFESLIDGNNCLATINQSVAVEAQAAPRASFENRILRVCPGQSAEIAMVLTGTPHWVIDYTENGVAQSWNIEDSQARGGRFTTSITPEYNRLYVLRSVRDAAGCSRELNDTLQVQTLSGFSSALSATNSGPACNNLSPVQLIASPVENAEGYLWTGPNGFSSSLRNPFLSVPTIGGVYSVVAFAGNCTTPVATTAVTIGVIEDIAITGNSVVCSGSALNLNASVPGTNALYFWSGPGGFSATTPSITIPNIASSQAGGYEAWAIIGNCTTRRAFTNVVVRNEALGEIISNTAAICSGSGATTVTLNLRFTGLAPFSAKVRANGNIIAELNGITTSVFNYQAPVSGNTLFDLVEVSDAGSCGGRSAGFLQVTTNPGPLLTVLEQNNADCNGARIRVGASGGSGGYVYSLDGINYTNTTGLFTGLTLGTQQIYVKDLGGCVSSLLVDIQGLAAPAITALNMSETSATLSWEGVPTAASYTVEYGEINGALQAITGITGSTAVISGLQPGKSYRFRVIPICAGGAPLRASDVQVGVTRAMGCSSPMQVQVSSVTQESAVVSWTATGGTCYVVSWGLEDIDSSLWQQVLVPHPGRNFTISGLLPGRRYAARLRSNCTLCSFTTGELSDFSSPIAFTTGANKVAGSETLNSLRLYPNPTQGVLSLTFEASVSGAGSVKVIDVTGRLLQENSLIFSEGNNAIELDFSSLANGIYWVRLEQGEFTQSVKAVKE